MSIKGNQNAATYKKDIVLSFINQFPNASTMAIARMIYDKHKLDFTSLDNVRGNVRRYRGENGVNNSPVSKAGQRTETQKKQSMSKTIDLPDSDYEKCEDSLCPSKDYCYRFTAKSSTFCQTYGMFNREDDADNYDMFWPNDKDSNKCKLKGVKKEGEMCNLNYCTYPKCVQSNYCEYCHKVEGEHKMSCPTRKIQCNL